MARVKVEEVVDYLESDFRKALAATIKEVAPTTTFDERAAFKIFLKAVGKYTGFETVPDSYVDKS